MPALAVGDRGPDVSNWQGAVDWAAAAASGCRFAFAKASEGTDWADKTFRQNWPGMKAAGLVRGCFHFARPDSGSPEEEARWFLAAVTSAGSWELGDMLVLDMEDGTGDLAAWALRWLRFVESQTGIIPILYSGLWFLGPHGLLAPELQHYPLWLAAYQSEPPDAPSGFSLRFWQHTDKASIPGIIGLVDESVVVS